MDARREEEQGKSSRNVEMNRREQSGAGAKRGLQLETETRGEIGKRAIFPSRGGSNDDD